MSEVEGVEQVTASLRKAQIKGDVLVQMVLAAAGIIEEEASRRAPGPNITKKVVEKKQTRASAEVGPDADHWYYRFFELGVQPHEVSPQVREALQFIDQSFREHADHPGMAADPFLRPALDQKGDAAAEAAGEVVMDYLRGAAN